MNMWFIGCTHFEHRNIIELAGRPHADIRSMNYDLVSKWNRTVKPCDIVFHLGDFSFGNATQMREMLGILLGKKILIRGNHDRGIQAMTNAGFQAVLENATIQTPWGSIFLQHRPLYSLDDAPMGVVAVVHAHIHRGHKEDLERADECTKVPNFCVNVSSEVVNYMPISLSWIHRQLLDKKITP